MKEDEEEEIKREPKKNGAKEKEEQRKKRVMSQRELQKYGREKEGLEKCFRKNGKATKK